jgi:hypothetical protein
MKRIEWQGTAILGLDGLRPRRQKWSSPFFCAGAEACEAGKIGAIGS